MLAVEFTSRTLRHRHRRWEKEKSEYEYEYECDEYKYLDYCWDSIRHASTTMISQPRQKRRIILSTSPTVLNTYVAAAAPISFMTRLNKRDKDIDIDDDKLGLHLLARKVGLLLTTVNVRNNEISLPRSITELLQQGRTKSKSKILEEAMKFLIGRENFYRRLRSYLDKNLS